jgi:enediyne biosynthesis protein E4
VDLDLNHLPAFGSGPFCQYRGIPVSCGPRGLKGSRDRLYHNNGDGTFTDVSDKLGIDPETDYGLGVLWLDYDQDGCLDLYVSNDSSPSRLYHNNCKGGFTEVGMEAGVAFSADGLPQAGMGVDSADYDNDGWRDLVKAGYVNPQVDGHSFGITYAERNFLFHNELGHFSEVLKLGD